MKYKPGDEVLIKGEITDVHEGTDNPYFVAHKHGYINWVSEDKIIPADKTYEMGLNDAWELVEKIYDMKCDSIEEIFGVKGGFYEVIRNFTFEDCRDKIEAYEKEKEIKVGSIVEYEDGCLTGVITKIIDKERAYIVWTDGSCGSVKKECLKNTGRTVETFTELLRQIGE